MQNFIINAYLDFMFVLIMLYMLRIEIIHLKACKEHLINKPTCFVHTELTILWTLVLINTFKKMKIVLDIKEPQDLILMKANGSIKKESE